MQRSMYAAFISILALSLLAFITMAQKHDATLEKFAKGSAVVIAVCQLIENSCIFPDDKLFCRRLAYVESLDGNDPDTFRPQYNGGIWQVKV